MVTTELTAALTRLMDFLGRHGEGHWAGVIGRTLSAHGEDQAALARSVQGFCAGLARLVISPTNGHGVQVCAIDGTNRTLTALRTEVCAAAERAAG